MGCAEVAKVDFCYILQGKVFPFMSFFCREYGHKRCGQNVERFHCVEKVTNMQEKCDFPQVFQRVQLLKSGWEAVGGFVGILRKSVYREEIEDFHNLHLHRGEKCRK